MPENPPRALLSGGIGSGKSTAGHLFVDLGAGLVSADEAGHRAIGPGGEARDAVARRWPECVVDGEVDRERLAAIAFSDPRALADLEALTHPVVRRDVLARVAAMAAPLILVEVPLLADVIGEGWPRIVVDAPDEIRTARLIARGMDPRDIARRIAAQPGRSAWLAAADVVIDNSRGLDHLAAECERTFRLLTSPGPVGDGG